jgi:DNA-binding winged helix-turn-helix (wHTH) protein
MDPRLTHSSRLRDDRIKPGQAPGAIQPVYNSHLWNGPDLTFGPFRLDPRQRLIFRASTPLRLGSRAREILFTLMERAGESVRKSELIARVWPDTIVEESTLRVHIAALRKALGDGRSGMRYVENINGYGYRFIASVIRLDAERCSAASHASAAEHPHNVPGPVLDCAGCWCDCHRSRAP